MKISRQILSDLKNWKANPVRKPLILQGARQVGKTWIFMADYVQSFLD